MARKLFWFVGVIGLVMIAAPFVIGLPGRASSGQSMMDDFRPIMQQANVDTTAKYYNDVFVPLGQVVPAMSQENIAKFQQYTAGIKAMGTDAQKLVPALSQALNMTPEQVQQFMATQFPAMSQMLAGLPQMEQDFGGFVDLMSKNVGIFQQVPAGLAHYKPLVTTMQGNVHDFDQIDGLPSFPLFTWFFLVPGVLLVALAGAGLFAPRFRSESLGASHGAGPIPAH